MSRFPSDERSAAQTHPRRGALAVFLAVRADVLEAHQVGYPYKTIWEHLHEIGRFQYGYKTFLRYAKACVANSPENLGATVKKHRPEES